MVLNFIALGTVGVVGIGFGIYSGKFLDNDLKKLSENLNFKNEKTNEIFFSSKKLNDNKSVIKSQIFKHRTKELTTDMKSLIDDEFFMGYIREVYRYGLPPKQKEKIENFHNTLNLHIVDVINFTLENDGLDKKYMEDIVELSRISTMYDYLMYTNDVERVIAYIDSTTPKLDFTKNNYVSIDYINKLNKSIVIGLDGFDLSISKLRDFDKENLLTVNYLGLFKENILKEKSSKQKK